MPATATSQVDATAVAAMADPTASKCCRCQPCHLWEPACRRLQHRRSTRLQSLPWQLPQVLQLPAMPSVGAGMPATATPQVAATPVAAMAAPTASNCCHCQPCHLWQPACRRLQHRRSTRLQSLPWQLPQLASAATASHAICGSRHAGDCSTEGCRDSSRCHGSSHNCCHCQSCHLWEPACRRLQHRRLPRLQSLPWQLPQVLPLPAKPSVGAGRPATATPQVAATPVAAMAAPTSAAAASQAICGSRHAGDCSTEGCRDSSRCHGSSHS